MEFLINETTKWNAIVPVKGVEAGVWLFTYTPFYADGAGGWIQGEKQLFQFSSLHPEMRSLIRYRRTVKSFT